MKKRHIIFIAAIWSLMGIFICYYPLQNWYVNMKYPEKWDRRHHFIVYNCCYLPEFSDHISDSGIGADNILYEGEITSSVDSYEHATENEQSNFGTGYKYRYRADGVMEIYYLDRWRECTLESFKFGNRWYDLDDLSDETVTWIMDYNKLTPKEKDKITDFPAPK